MNKFSKLLCGLVLAAGAPVAQSALAADAGIAETPASYGPWMVRLRALGVIPDEDGTVSAGGAVIAGSDVSIDDSVVPELDISYFFNENFALELILAVTPHDVAGAGTLASTDLGDAWLLPPTLLAQYHFNLTDRIKPYVGAGINYTIFFNEDAGQFLDIDYDDSFGVALQAGVDIAAGENWGFNLDVKKLFLDTDVTITTAAGTLEADVDIDPWIIGAGLYYRF